MRRKSIAFLLLCIIVLLSGCWSKKELSDLAITTAIGIDKADDRYLVSAQIINPGEIAGDAISSRTAVSTFITEGRSLSEALRKLTNESPRRLYLAHVRVIVIGEELAREGVSQVLDFLSRNHETRTDFYIMVAKEQMAHNVLSILTPIEKIPANKIYSSIKVSEETWAPTMGVQLDNIVSNIISEGINPVLTGISYEGDVEIGSTIRNVEEVPSPTHLQLENMSIFKGDKLVEWLDLEEAKGVNYILDNVNETVGVIKCEDEGNITVNIYDTKTDIKTKIEKGEPKVAVEVNSDISIEEVSKCKKKITEKETIKWIEKEVSKQMQNLLERAIEVAQKHKTDIFGFGDTVNRVDPKIWNEMKEDWNDEIFPNLKVDLELNVNVRRLGTITDSFQDKGME